MDTFSVQWPDYFYSVLIVPIILLVNWPIPNEYVNVYIIIYINVSYNM